MGGPGDASCALVNMAIICRSLLETDGISEPTKSEARELLEKWMSLARQSSTVESADSVDEEGEALLHRMESFVREQAEQRSVARR
jgi:hypothetical protein